MIGNKPCIYIYSADENLRILSEIEAGLEEEGIPYQVVSLSNYELERLDGLTGTLLHSMVRESAEHGIFSCGIAIWKEQIVLSMVSQGKNHILDEYRIPTHEEARRLGSNAARCVKRIPLRIK